MATLSIHGLLNIIYTSNPFGSFLEAFGIILVFPSRYVYMYSRMDGSTMTGHSGIH